MLKIGLLGAGRVAGHYKKLFKMGKISGAEVVAVCDLDHDKSDSFAKEFQCKAFYNVNEFAESKIYDLAIILTPSGYHYEHALKLLDHKKHLLVEKLFV